MTTQGNAKLPGNCAGHDDPDMFYDRAREQDVKRVCSGCPVTTCLADARARGEVHGWWQSTWLGMPDDVMVVAEASTLRVSIPEAHNRARYNSGCRCPICTEANRAYKAKYDQNGPVTTRPIVIDNSIPLFEGVA